MSSSDGTALAFTDLMGRTSLRTSDLATSADRQSAQFPDDGHDQAPRAPPQRPNLLAGYAARPPWQVAGVDYAVGVPAGTQLQDWQVCLVVLASRSAAICSVLMAKPA